MTLSRLINGSASVLALGLLTAVGAGPVAAKPVFLLYPGQSLAGMSRQMTQLPGEIESLGVDDGESECEGECYPEYYPELPKEDPRGPTETSAGQTDIVVKALETATGACQIYIKNERVDCFRQELHRIVQAIPSDGKYGEMRNAMSEAAAELDAIVRANQDPNATPVRRTVQTAKGPRTSSASVRPIAPDRVNAANAQAEAVLDKLATRLLRSASGSEKVHFERAAQAINSAKVLLRSA